MGCITVPPNILVDDVAFLESRPIGHVQRSPFFKHASIENVADAFILYRKGG